jgi:hypothetical protein
MRKILKITASVLVLITFMPIANAQEEENKWSAGLDIYSSYIWRGAKFGSGPAFQPSVSFGTGGFEIGAWGSVNSSTDEAFEMDLYASYSIGGLTFGLTDYYLGGDWTEYKTMHSLEPCLSYGVGGFSLSAYYMFLAGKDAVAAVPGSPGVVDLTTGEISPAIEGIEAVEGSDFGSSGDFYIEAGYSFKYADLALGAGDGQYTKDGDFSVCVVSIGISKEIKLSESFSLPVAGAAIFNPSTGGFFITVGISL